VNRNDEPVAIVPDIENHKSGDIVGVGKARSQLLEVSPSRLFHNPYPGADLRSTFAMIFRRLL
jgi:hypothetical protein